MILRSRGGDRAVRAAMFADSDKIPRWSSASGGPTYAGKQVTPESATGLPVVMDAIRLISESMAMLTKVVQERRDGVWVQAPDAPEQGWMDRPHGDMTASQWWAYALAVVNGWGGFYALKARDLGSTVRELSPFTPGRCQAVIEGGELRFKVTPEVGAKPETLTAADVFYVPGVMIDHPLIGASPIFRHRHAIGQMQALEEWMGKFYSNGAMPGAVVTLAGHPPKETRDAYRESWNSMHQGANAHQLALLWGGATFESIGISPKDAEYVASRNLSVQETARIFRMDSGMLNDPASRTEGVNPEHTSIRFSTYTLGYWIARFQDAFRWDRDLFAAPNERRPALLTDPLLMVDFKTRAEGWHSLKQDGIATANEARPQFGLPPHEDGDVLQVTPVGGAPNEEPPEAEEPSPPEPAPGSPTDDARGGAMHDLIERAKRASNARAQTTRAEFTLAEEVRDSGAGDGQWTFRGHAAVFGVKTDIAGLFTERVDSRFFDDVLSRNPDVHCTREHDFSMVLGRTRSKTCELRTDGRGLHVWTRVADTSYARDLRALMERGDVDQMSFMFTVAEDEWHTDADGNVERVLLRCGELYDVTVCAQGAYPSTDAQIASRSAAMLGAPEDVRKLLEDRAATVSRASQDTPAPAEEPGGPDDAAETPVADDRASREAHVHQAIARARAIEA